MAAATFLRFEATDSSDQDDRNNKIGMVFLTESESNNPWIITIAQGAGEAGLLFGPLYSDTNDTIKIDYTRNNLFRILNFYKNTTVFDGAIDVDTVQWFADQDIFTNSYTFNVTGTLTLNPDYDGQVWDTGVTLQYQIRQGENGQIEAPWQTSLIFTGLSLELKTLEVKDEYGGYISADLEFIASDTLTLITDLPGLSLTNDPMVVVWDSVLKEVAGVRYKFSMYDIDDTLLLQTLVYPDIENSFYGIYNLNMLYNNYTITEKYYSGAALIVTDNVLSYYYTVNDGEGLPTLQSDVKYAIKGATSYDSAIDIDDYIGLGDSSHKFLTNWTGDYLFRTDDYNMRNFAYGYFTERTTGLNTDNFNHIAIVRYRYGDTRDSFSYTDTNRVNYIATIDPDKFDNKVYSIPFGMMNINDAYDDNTVVDVNSNIISSNFLLDSDTEYYEIHFVDIINPTTIQKRSESQYAKINKDESCLKHVPTRFIWRDKLGSYNTFAFNGINVKEYNFERNVVSNDYHSLINNEWAYNIGDRGRSNVNIRQTENHSAVSGWLNDDLSESLMGLYASADAFIIIDDETFPVIITVDNVQQKTIRNNRLFNHSISYQMAYDKNTNG